MPRQVPPSKKPTPKAKVPVAPKVTQDSMDQAARNDAMEDMGAKKMREMKKAAPAPKKYKCGGKVKKGK